MRWCKKIRNPFTMKLRSQSKQPTNYIETVPVEIREHIFSFLPQSDALSIRVVNKQWKEEIEKYYKFKIDLERGISEQGLKLLLNSPIKYFKVGYIGTQLITSMANFKQSFKTFFHYPGMMRQLIIASLQNISEKNVRFLLQECGDSLEYLYIDFDLHLENESKDEAWTPMKFRNLKKLQLIDSRFANDKAPPITSRNDIFLNTIQNLAASSLELKSVIIEVKVKPTKNEEDLNVLPKNEILEMISTCCDRLVMNQKKLEYVKLDQILPYKASLVNGIIAQNFKTMHYLEIYFRYVDQFKSDVLDISHFCKCVTLKELYLVLPWTPKGRLTQDVINFKLPSTLQKACVAGFRILSNELKQCVTKHKAAPGANCVYGESGDENVRENNVSRFDDSDICYYVLF